MQGYNNLGAEGAGHLAGALAGMTGMKTLWLVRLECILDVAFSILVRIAGFVYRSRSIFAT